jgi:prophage DNA circulation protein
VTTWRDQMGPASFREARFYVDTAERSGGRRGVTHEYPFRDQPHREDTGGMPRTFNVEGHVIGENYFAARDALIAELEKPGPGELVHPYYGTLRVAVDGKFSVRETTDRGGMATFSIPFIVTAVDPVQPTTTPDGTTKVAASVTAARASIASEFLAAFITDASLTESVAGALRSATLAVNGVLSNVEMGLQELATMRRRVSDLESSVSALLGTPADIVSAVTDLLAGIPTEAVLNVYHFAPGVRPPATTPNREIEQTNFDAMQRLVQRLTVARAAELATSVTYDSYDAAVAAREAITDLLDEQTETAGDEVYPALMQLRADLVRAVPGDASDLPRLLDHTPAETVPSLVLAHRLYGNIDLEADLIARNGVAKPGFITGGRVLEVLSDGT